MGCQLDFGDDFEKCQILIDEYEDLLCKEQSEKIGNKKDSKINQEKEDLKKNIREMLESINNKAIGLAQVDKLQKLNQKYQDVHFGGVKQVEFYKANSSSSYIISLGSDDKLIKVFDLNDLDNKRLSITLSCHSSESAASSSNEINKIVEEMYNEDITDNSNSQSNDTKNEEHKDKNGKNQKGTKKFGFKHIKNTISKTFSKASFRKFSISHKKATVNSNTADAMMDQQDLNFSSKEEQEEFNNFVNNLNTKKGNSRQRPSLTGLFLSQEPSSINNSNTTNESIPPQPRKKSIENTNYETALRHLCEVLDYEEPMVLAQYLKAANGDENLALKNYLRDSNTNSTVKEHHKNNEGKDAPLEMNEMKNIEKNSKKQAPVIIDRKKKRSK